MVTRRAIASVLRNFLGTSTSRCSDPAQFLSWVVGGDGERFSPVDCAEWLKGRLPRPVDDLVEWKADGDDAD